MTLADRLLSPDIAARHARVTRRTVMQWIARGHLTALRLPIHAVGEPRIVLDKRELDAWLKVKRPYKKRGDRS